MKKSADDNKACKIYPAFKVKVCLIAHAISTKILCSGSYIVVDHSHACSGEQIRKEKGLVIKQSDRNKEEARELVETDWDKVDDGINHSEAAVTPDDSKSHNKVRMSYILARVHVR